MYKLRPHHGLCTAFFCGHGYSDVFTRNMREKLRLFGQTDPWIMLTDGADCLCAACPHNLPGHCEDTEKVHAYDQAVLAHLGLQTGAVLRWEAFCRLVDTRILAPESWRRSAATACGTPFAENEWRMESCGKIRIYKNCAGEERLLLHFFAKRGGFLCAFPKKA